MTDAKRTKRVVQALRNAEKPRQRGSRQPSGVHVLKEDMTRDLLRRLGAHEGRLSLGSPNGDALTAGPPPASIEDRFNTVLGCKTSEVALELLAEVVRLEHLPDTVTDDRANASLMKAAAVLAELQPATATEALLAAQMVGTYRTAMLFLANATKPEESFDGRDRNVLRALRLMRLFTEQTETMARLKGTGGQQRVVVEHVTVNAGGKAFVAR